MQTGEVTEAPATREERAEWFLDRLGNEPIDVERLAAFLDGQYAAGHHAEADELAELLQDALADTGRIEEAVEVLQISAERHGEADYAPRCRKTITRLMRGDRDRQVFVDHVGFGTGLPARESVRRVLLLLRLKPGVLCRDKTWGFGVVDDIDTFYKRVTINFRKKRGHEMSFDYGAETLEILDEDHLLARLHRDPEAMRALVSEDPAKVVLMALESYGSMPVARLQEMLVPDIFGDGQWKAFWDGARKALKTNPLVEIPVKRNEPIRLHKEVQQQDEAWFNRLAAERDLKKLVNQIETLFDETEADAWPDNAAGVLANRLGFVLKGAEGRHPDLLARGLMLADASGLDAAGTDAEHYLSKALHPAAFLGASEDLSIRHFRAYLDFLLGQHGDEAAPLMLAQFSYLPLAALTEVVDAACRHGHEEACRRTLGGLLEERPPGITLLNWAARNLDRVKGWELPAPVVLANEMVTVLELLEGGNRSKERSQLNAQFEKRTWLERVLAEMTGEQRKAFLHRIKDSTAFSIMDRRSVLAGMIKLYPDLEAEMVAAAAAAVSPRSQGLFSSHRSYEERRKQLERIVSVEIPSNSKEIAVARSYGDLRENHEFKAAKEMQGLLMRRQAELEKMLAVVKSTDFVGFPSERAGIGTGALLRYPDGKTETYYMLGEWDRDEALSIISCQSGMAKALEGSFPGDEVTVPSENGNVPCTVEEVTDLPPEILAWIVAIADEG